MSYQLSIELNILLEETSETQSISAEIQQVGLIQRQHEKTHY